MAAATKPIFSLAPNTQWLDTIKAVNTTTDLTSGTIYLLFTADSTNGGYVDRILFQSLGTNTATVIRIWINNGSATSTLANNSLLGEVTAPSVTVSQIAKLAPVIFLMGYAIPLSYRLYATLGTDLGTVGYDGVVIAGKY